MKRRYRLYLDSSFWRRLGDRTNVEMRRESYRFLNRGCRWNTVLASPLVISELRQTPDLDERKVIERRFRDARVELITGRHQAEKIAQRLMVFGPFGVKMLEDLMHLGYAVIGNSDAVVTWDRRTMSRNKVRLALQAYCRREGYSAPMIGTPEEVSQWLGIS